MRYVAEPLARSFRVYTLDLLGFGLSDRPKLRYSPDLYVRLLARLSASGGGPERRWSAAGLSGAYCDDGRRCATQRWCAPW